jgi:hypothetical protein
LSLFLWYTSSDAPFAAGNTQDRLGTLISPENVPPVRSALPSRELCRFVTLAIRIDEAEVRTELPCMVMLGAETP